MGQHCPHCGDFIKSPGHYQHIPKCEEIHNSSKNLLLNLKSTKLSQKGREKAKKEHGYSNLKSVNDWLAELSENLEKAGLKPTKEKFEDELGFTPGFYRFVALGAPNDYHHPIHSKTRGLIDDMRQKTGLRVDTAQSFYTPADDMYGTATGSDTWYDHGRVPVSHLEILASKRSGALFTACNRPAVDIMDNGYDFVKVSDPDGNPVENPTIELVQGWERKVKFHRKIAEIVDFDARFGLGFLMADKLWSLSQSPEALGRSLAITCGVAPLSNSVIMTVTDKAPP